MPLTAGARVGAYEILQPIGAGGMGQVYRARHLKLRRDVAIKILPDDLAGDHSRRARFEREARTASALNHPNIVTIHDIAEHEGTTLIVMELVEGRTLRDRIADGPLSVDETLRIASQLVDGLAKAHAAEIVHRDIKPANVMITPDGLVKILDFGLAKPLTAAPAGESTAGTLSETREGMIVGTPHYMSPEQLSGDAIDHRSDQFALGVLLYEMLGGTPPFDGPSLGAVISAILVAPTPPLRDVRPEVSPELERIIRRCLEKDPEKRYPSTAALAQALREYEHARERAARSVITLLRRPAAAGMFAAVLLTLGTAGWLWSRGAGARWAEHQAIAEITRFIDEGRLYEAYRSTLRAQRYRPDDPELQKLVDRITLPITVNTVPSGAEVAIKDYATPDADWEQVGVTPMTLPIPYALMRWRITLAGHEPFEGAPFSGTAIGALGSGLVLDSIGTRPEGMVRVPGGPVREVPPTRPSQELPIVVLEPYFLDRYEVTNEQFEAFVTAGGYRTRELWPDPMVRAGREVPWEDAMAAFRDETGRAGPSTWQLGTFAEGEHDHPVGGVSWYEAAAYCAWAGKTLPTVYHWFGALGQDQLSDILLHSNMDGSGVAPVGDFRGLSAFGTYDMAGNVREWTWNAAPEGRHYILGGAWNEPTYLFKHLVAVDSWARDAVNGVRCALHPTPPPDHLTATVAPRHDFEPPAPVTDAAFELLRGLYVYDRDPLNARVEREDTLPAYRRQTVSFRTAYGEERMEVHLLIPHDAEPPYQSVIWFPGDDVFLHRSSERFSSAYLFDFIPRTGRVLVHPVYMGMYERFVPPSFAPSEMRDRMIRWAQDISRTIDYLGTRSDFDTTKIGYYGFSAGAIYGPVFTAVEPRIAASILLGGGVIPRPFRPESDPVVFAPRSRVPTLMINGRDDFILPYDAAQRPLFELLGTPAGRKRHARLEGGHIPYDETEIIREVLDWLDQYLGPVEVAARSGTVP